MNSHAPIATELDQRFSEPEARPIEWTEASRQLADSGIFWIATVRGEGVPHVTPMIAVFVDGSLFFCTGPTEQKARNLANNAHCTITTGCNQYGSGLDVVVEGRAERVTEDERLRRLAAAFEAKYGSDWHFDVREAAFHHEGGEAWVFEVEPIKAFGFDRNGPAGQTRWRFAT